MRRIGKTRGTRAKKNSKCAAQPIGRARLHEPFARILADGLEETVPARAGTLAVSHHQRLIDQPRQQIEHVALVDAVAAADLLGGLERPAGGEHGQTAEQLTFDMRQQLVAPVHGRLERPLPRDGCARAAGEQAEPVLQTRLDLLRRQDDDASGRELDGEGNAIEAPAESGDGFRVVKPSARMRGRRPARAR